jgi:2-(1,2-epoxy-1,2-dihydrophenyl)acetyl-CoA isomerase
LIGESRRAHPDFTKPTATRKAIVNIIEAFDEGVVTLTLNNPAQRNALSPSIVEGLLEALPRLDNDPEVRVVVLTGAGGAFCAGGDVREMASRTAPTAESEDGDVKRLRAKMEIARLLHEIRKPTIAMVQGAAAGAGLALALACDMRIASESARFVTAFAKVGLSGDFGGAFFLTQLVGTSKARDLYYRGGSLTSTEALSLGLVGRVVPDDDLAETTRALAREIACGPIAAIGFMKANMNLAESASLAEVLDAEAVRMVRASRTADHKEAARAFVEKRKAVFVGH